MDPSVHCRTFLAHRHSWSRVDVHPPPPQYDGQHPRDGIPDIHGFKVLWSLVGVLTVRPLFACFIAYECVEAQCCRDEHVIAKNSCETAFPHCSTKQPQREAICLLEDADRHCRLQVGVRGKV